MNISTYIFGSFANGYSQYPSDYTQTVFKNYYAHSTAPAQMIVHRENSLIYYGYIRKLEAERYIGLCVVLNSLMLTDFKEMFNIFENTITSLVVNGTFLQFDDSGNIVSRVSQLYTNQTEISRIVNHLRDEFDRLEGKSKPLPPISYGIAKNEIKTFSIDESVDEIVKASTMYSYTFIYKKKDFDTQSLSSYRGILSRLNKEKKELITQCDELKSQNTNLRNKQRNTLWVGLLSVVVVIMFMVLYFKVINPSEVTHYETGEFIYYGPLKDKKPNGIGVAIYPSNDKDGRKYYIGNFVNGKRQDSNAMLFYKDGDYYYGSMSDDNWGNGMFYVNSDDSYFRGDFKNNQPYSGTWYEHKKRYELINGEKQY